MGSSVSNCCCERIDQNPLNVSKKKSEEDIDKIIYGRMTLKNLLYYYDYKLTRVCLIKSKDISEFFESRNLLKIIDNEKINDYFDKIFTTNFLDLNGTTFSIMKYSDKNDKNQLIKNKNISKSNIFYIEDIKMSYFKKNDRISTTKSFYQTILDNLKYFE